MSKWNRCRVISRLSQHNRNLQEQTEEEDEEERRLVFIELLLLRHAAKVPKGQLFTGT